MAPKSCGEIYISICYQPSSERLVVVVLKAKNLLAKDITGSSDPYVKVSLEKEGKRVEKRKTAVKPANLNPTYNESFVFNINKATMKKTSVRLSVIDHDLIGKNEMIGEVVLGTKSGPAQVKHWHDMLDNPYLPIAHCHQLKAS